MGALLMTAGGACLVWLLVPTYECTRDIHATYDWYLDHSNWGIFPPIGAVVGGAIAWIIEFTANRAAVRTLGKDASTNDDVLGSGSSVGASSPIDGQEPKNGDT